MERNKKHFRHLLFYCFNSKKTVADSSQNIFLSLLHQLKHVSTGFDDSKGMIWKTKNSVQVNQKSCRIALLDEKLNSNAWRVS